MTKRVLVKKRNVSLTLSPSLLEERACSLSESSLFPGEVSEMLLSFRPGCRARDCYSAKVSTFMAASREGCGLSSPISGSSHDCFMARPMCSFWDPPLCLIHEKLKWLHLRLQTLADDSGTVQESSDSFISCAGMHQRSKAH